MWIKLFVVAGITAAPAMLCADFSYQQTTQITGGTMVGMMKLAGSFSKQAREAGEPTVSAVYLKGNRMAQVTAHRTEIVDLDRETVTEIDESKRQYTVMTFAQMKQQIDASVAKAKQQQAKSAAQPAKGDATTDLTFHVNVRQTGTAKSMDGVETKESIMAMTVDATDRKSGDSGTLAITNDMWMAPEIAGYGEVREFYQRYAVKMGRVMSGVLDPQITAMQPGAGQGMADMAKEIGKLHGIPVLQVMRMGMSLDGKPLPAASEAPLPQTTTPAMPTVGDVAQQTATSAIASKLGSLGSLSGIGSGLGGFGRKKKADATAAANSTVDSTSDAVSNAAAVKATGTGGADASVQTAVLMETKTQMTSFSQASVDEARFTIPLGYTRIEARSTE